MKESFLHYIWQNGFFDQHDLTTNQSNQLLIRYKGLLNSDAGPDFLNAQILIDDILWAGHVEIHKQASDWYAHGHEKDPAYDNVILHVVYEDNMPVYNSHNQQIPTLELSKYIDKKVLKTYQKLFETQAFLPCQHAIDKIDAFTLTNFKQRLFIERLEDKYQNIKNLLVETKNDWHQIFYQTLLKYTGGSVNKEAFELIGRLLPHKIFIKYKDDLPRLEALLFGVAGLLNDDKNDDYYRTLQKEYRFLKNKHHLDELPPGGIKFHRLRPSNFPTIRLAQFARIYHETAHLFEQLLELNSIEQAVEILSVTASDYWDTHYNFDKITKHKKKATGKDFVNLILINVVIPIKFAYQQHLGDYDNDKLIELIEKLPAEKNKIIKIYRDINLPAKNALDTQAFIQLNKNYCIQNKCLSCDIGHAILKQGL